MKIQDFLNIMDNICKNENDEIGKTSNSTLRFEVIQHSNFFKTVYKTISYKENNYKEIQYYKHLAYIIADFYNRNWQGNKDFMHIPNAQQVFENLLKYPIIIARDEGKDEILAISTIKYDENTNERIDPYFPIQNAKYFSITGVLVNRNSSYKGLGKKIYEIAVRGAHKYSKEHPDTQIMCVIDCRNKYSMYALASAVENINKNELYKEQKELPINIVGYYELLGKKGDSLIEAPTVVVEVGLKEREKKNNNDEKITIKYNKKEGEELLYSLKNELREKLLAFGIDKSVTGVDGEDGENIVKFTYLKDELSLKNIVIIPNGTDDGNNRVPISDEFIKIINPNIVNNSDKGDREN